MTGLLRPMRAADVDAVLAVQGPGSVRALASVFPQEQHPFPTGVLRERWLREVADPAIECSVVEVDGRVAGFVAVQGDELLHFGTAVERWGSGLAGQVHDETVEALAGRGVRVAWLRVFEANRRARRFYERRGWLATGDRTRSTFAPHPVLLRYELLLGPAEGARAAR